MSNYNADREEDFEILYSAEQHEIEKFSPSVLFIDQFVAEMVMDQLWEAVTPGGIVIFPENAQLEDSMSTAPNFFRRISFSQAKTNLSGNNRILVLDDMDIPLQTTDEKLIDNLNGLADFAQATAILQEDFWEAVAGFQDQRVSI